MWLSGYPELPDGSSSATHGLTVNQSDPTGMTVLFTLGSVAVTPFTGVYKSTDGGVTWRCVLPGVSGNANGFTRHASPVITVDDARPWIVWAGVMQGLYKSTDGGETWAAVQSFNNASWFKTSERCGQTVVNNSTYTMALVSLVPPDPVTGTSDPAFIGHVMVGAETMGYAFSSDDGSTWTHLTQADGTLPVYLSTPWRFHRMPNGTAFTGLDCAGGMGKTSGRVFRVEVPDGNVSAWATPASWNWTDITPTDLGNDGFWGLVDTPLGFNGGVLVVSSSAFKSMYTSVDSGATWQQRNISVGSPAPCWQPNKSVWMQNVAWGRNNIVISSRNPGQWLLSSGFGVAASSDYGDTWAWSSHGIGQVVNMRCHSHPSTANWTFCGVADLTGFIINDAGMSSKGIAVFSAEPGYWLVDFGRGVAWDNFTAGAKGLSFAGNAQQWPYPGQWISWPDPGAAVTTLTYTPVVNTSGVLNNVTVTFAGLLQSSDDPLDLLLLASSKDNTGYFNEWNASKPLWAYDGGIVRSVDGGASWKHVAAQPLNGNIGTVWTDRQQLSLDGGDVNTRWWALWDVGLFVSRDRGETWGQPLPFFTSTQFEVIVAPDTSTATGGAGCMYILGAGSQAWSKFKPGNALLHTRDFGVSWDPVGNFSANYAAPTLAVHKAGHIALTANLNDDLLPHVWVSLDSGANWTAVDHAQPLGQYYGPIVAGLEWDAVDPSVLYISLEGHSVVVVKLATSQALSFGTGASKEQ